MESQDNVYRKLYFLQLCKTTEANYAKDPLDTVNLTMWAAALLELARFQNVPDSKMMVLDAISKVEEALTLNPKSHLTLWFLGDAQIFSANRTQDWNEAKEHYDLSTLYFQRAVEEEPENEDYKLCLEISTKASELHAEIHNQDLGQQQTRVPTSSRHTTSSSTMAS